MNEEAREELDVSDASFCMSILSTSSSVYLFFLGVVRKQQIIFSFTYFSGRSTKILMYAAAKHYLTSEDKQYTTTD